MDYSDVLAQRIEGRLEAKTGRKKIIDAIMKHFDVTFDDIKRAENLIDSRFANDPLQYYFLADCVRTGRNLNEDYFSGDIKLQDSYEVIDAVRQAAEGVVPYQTYVIWRLWIEFGYETDAYSDFGLQPSLDNLENVAQVELMSYAESIIYGFSDV